MTILRYTEGTLDMRALGFHQALTAVEALIYPAEDIVTPPIGIPGAGTLPHVMKADVQISLDGPYSLHAWGLGLQVEGTALTGGVISWLRTPGIDLQHISLKATDLWAAVLTTDQGDDRALVSRFLRGNDWIDLGGGDDAVFAGAGKDLITDQEGADLILAGRGDDMIWASGEGDTILGGAGHDFISHDFGDARIFGGEGDDTLVGFGTHDTMTGGAGADYFVIGDPGRDVVRDFTHGEDKVVLSDVWGVTNGLHQVVTDAGLLLEAKGWKVLFRGITALTAEDFSEGPYALQVRAEQSFFDGWDYA